MNDNENPKPQSGRAGCGCLAGVALGVGLVFLTLALAVGLVVASAASLNDVSDISEYGTAKPECERQPTKKWMRGDGDKDAPQVLYVPLKGVISLTDTESDRLFGTTSDARSALRSIRAATRDKQIKGIWLDVDSPGGGVTDSDTIADALARFRASRPGRFVFVHMGALCCSGGYYVSAGANCIMARPTTITGSIGVIMRGVNAAELAKKIGVSGVTVASGENKALLDPLEPVKPEHVEIMRRPIAQDYERFLSIVADGRKIAKDKLRPLADGRVLSAQDALDAKLVDCIGQDEDAWAKVQKLADAEKIRLCRHDKPFSFKSLFEDAAMESLGRAFVRGAKAELSAAPSAEYRLR